MICDHPITARATIFVTVIAALLGASQARGAANLGPFGPYERIEASGHAVLADDDVADIEDRFAGRLLSIDELKSLADSFVEPCERAALALCRADIPARQGDAATLRVSISEGYVTDIEADPDIARIVTRVLAPVLAERPLTKETLDRAVANLGEVRGLTVSAVRPERLDGDAYRLVVSGKYRRGGLRGLATNRGSRRADPWRSVIVGDRGSVLTPGDSVQLAYLTRPESPDELSYGVLRYSAAPTRRGTTVYGEINASQSSPRTILEGRDAEGTLLRALWGIEHPIWRREGERVKASIVFEGVRATETEDDITLFTDELRIVRGSFAGERRRKKSRVTAQVTVSQGLDTLGAQGGSRPDGEVSFLTLAAEAVATRQLGKAGYVRAGVTAQASSAPLFFQEEFSLGGGSYGRAYDFGEVRGDSGIAGYLEAGYRIGTPALRSVLTPYGYVDTGSTWNEGAGLSSDGAVLWSAGGGVKIELPAGFGLDYELAVPLSDAPFTDDDDDVRHRVQVTWSSDG